MSKTPMRFYSSYLYAGMIVMRKSYYKAAFIVMIFIPIIVANSRALHFSLSGEYASCAPELLRHQL